MRPIGGRTATTLLALAAAATMTTAAAQAAEVARPERASPVDADHAMVVWSAYDAAAGGYRLMLRGTGTGSTRALPGAAISPVPFDADLGDDARHRRVVVYAACPTGPASCDVRLHRVADGRDQPVPAAARADRREHAPTISRGRLAWVVGGGQDGRPQVLLQDLGKGTKPVTLPGLPRKRCGENFDGVRGCFPVTGSIDELELRAGTLAQAAFTTTEGAGNTGELRIVDVARRTSERPLGFGAGESGQRVIGPSIEGPHVYAYKACFGDPSGCNRQAGTYRYDLVTHRLELAASRHQLSGFSVDGASAFRSEGNERLACEVDQGGYPGVPGLATGPCTIEEEPLPATWTRVVPRR
jgi:hypothetical protein